MNNPTFLEIFKDYINKVGQQNISTMDLFKKINENDELLTKDNRLYLTIYNETKNISSFLIDSIEKFHLLFNKNLKDFDDCLNYLEKIAIPNKCVCAGVIDSIPGWRCVDCSKYENAIYCNDCYIKSKDLHKNHKVVFLYSSSGMCDCGDPDSLYTFCPEHSGPYVDQEQIDNYISKTFEKGILEKLKEFFDDFFLRFSKFLILTEKCDYFCPELFDEKFKDNLNLSNEREDISLLKDNFCIVFQNLLHFIRLISEKNLGMLHLIANYFLKNHLGNQPLDDNYLTTHRCVNISENDIKHFSENKEKHACKCPFFRLFLSNYRDDIKSRENENQELLLSFSNNLRLRMSFCIIFFSIYKQIFQNKNEDIISNRNQFFLEDVTYLIAKKTHLLEESYEIFYQNFLKYINSPEIKNEFDSLNENFVEKIYNNVFHIYVDTRYYSKPKIRKLMTKKTSILKRVIDALCLMHNQNEFRSIVPHPQFQEKKCSLKFCELEFRLLNTIEGIKMYIEWEKTEYIKDIFKYIINKIINQEKEGVKQLRDDEYSYHLGLYRCFGLLLNGFCFNYAFNNNCTLVQGIQYFKKSFFESQNQVDILVDILLKDYFKLFGFIAGAKNNYFNYYDSVVIYSNLYFLIKESFLMDFTLLKYLFFLSEKKIDLLSYYKISNIENVYSSFENSFINKKTNKKEIEKANIDNTNKNEDNNSNNNNNDNILNFNNNPALLELLRNNQQRQLSPQLIRQFIMNNMNNTTTSLKDEKMLEESNCIMQWRLLLDILICLIKDDSCLYWNLIREYIETVSSKTKRDLFNIVKNNNYAMEDLKNILKEKILHEIIAKGNIIDLKTISNDLDKYLKVLFEENNEFNQVLDELTYNKMNGETKMFYLKDSYLKNIDINYIFSFKDKSSAQRYILDFKKDIIKPYNSYYYTPSKLTFEFNEMVYEKILLNKDNLELMIKILSKLFSNEKITEVTDIKSVRNSLLPVILNYLSMFGVINTKSFIKFKIENKELIKIICQILNDSIKKNKNNDILEKDLEENVKEIIHQLKRYEIIYESINEDFSKLNQYDYNTSILEKLRKKEEENKEPNSIKLIPEEVNKADDKKKKSKNIKDKFKKLIKNKNNTFMEKVTTDDEMFQAFNEQTSKNIDNIKDSNNEIMCFFCRNPINLDSFETPYGKIGLNREDYFYTNSIRATLRNELKKLINDNKNDIYDKIAKNIYSDIFNRIISCGHYFHTSCFLEGIGKNDNDEFTCPLCLKKQNILIPPLNRFRQKYNFLNSENINELFNENTSSTEFKSDDSNLFKEIIDEFLDSIKLKMDKDYTSFLDYKFPNYKAYFNYLENVFYIDGTTFHKHEQIDTLQNIILSLRFSVKTNKIFVDQIIKYIKEELNNLTKGVKEKEYIYGHTDNYMHYVNSFEKILLSLTILFNYDEMKETFKYLIYIILPYFAFGFYFRDLMLKKEFNKIDNIQFKKNMDMKNLQQYLKENNNQMLDYLNMFLKKFVVIKLVTDFNNKNDNIINSFNKLTLKELLSDLDENNFYKLFQKNENDQINFIDIFDILPRIFNDNEIFYNLLKDNLNYKNVFESIFKSVINKNDEEILVENEMIIQFSPIKFDFIHLENNVFDWIEKNLGKKCDICHKITKYSYICLICGDKVCHNEITKFHIFDHSKMCGEKDCIFVDMNNMKIIICKSNSHFRKLYPLYVNEAGIGPKGYEIGKEFNLSHEKLNLTIKNFVCNDIEFN